MNDFLQLTNRHTGESLRMRRIREKDGEVILTIDGSLPPHSNGPPAHVHWELDEEGSVTAGVLSARVGGKTVHVRAGESAVFPKGVVHDWWNEGDELLEVSGRVRPAGDLDHLLQGIFAVVNAGPRDRPSLFHLVHVLWRHRKTHTMMAPPRIVQPILFPIILALGHLLGKYRGSSWPGAPESCQGAPEVDGP